MSKQAAAFDEDDYKIAVKDTSNYFDQLRQMIIQEGWTTQDHATLNLLQEMPNSHIFYIIRKSDDAVVGGLVIIVTDNLVYGNTQIMRKGFRAGGMGIKLIRTFLKTLKDDLAVKPLIARAVRPMWRPYTNMPFKAKYFYSMYSVRFESRQELKDFFDVPFNPRRTTVPIRGMKPELFNAVIEYDKMVTGQDRSTFLKNYFSIDFVDGLALVDENWQIKGLTAIAPCGNIDGQYKLNPIYASNCEDAAFLVHSIANAAKHPNASFVTHIRQHSAGEAILHKCRNINKKLTLVGATICSTTTPVLYKDKSRPELIYAPTNSPAHFDG